MDVPDDSIRSILEQTAASTDFRSLVDVLDAGPKTRAPYTYTWYLDGVFQSGATGNTFSYTNDGSNFTVSVTVTDALGRSASAATDVTVNACGQQLIC